MAKKKEIITAPNKQMGRPRFEFTQERLRQIYDLASFMCNKQEIGTIIGCSHDTIERNPNIGCYATVASGYTHSVSGVATANLASMNGVAKADMSNCNGA